MKQGTKIPVQTIVNNTVSVQFVDAVLELDVTPQITADGTVYMDVTVENDQIDQAIPRVQGIPAIDTQAAETKVTDCRRRNRGDRRHHRHEPADDRSTGAARRQRAGHRQSVQAHDGQLDVSGIAVLPDAAHSAVVRIGREVTESPGPDAVLRTGHEVSSRSRIDRLRLCFSSLRADAFLVSHLPNIRYLCGFTGSAGLLLVESSRSTLFTDSRYTFQAKEEVAGARVPIAKRGLLRAWRDDLRRQRGRRHVAYSPSARDAWPRRERSKRRREAAFGG